MSWSYGNSMPPSALTTLRSGSTPVTSRPPEARTGEDEGAPQGLRDVARVDVAADDPGHHGPEGKEVVAGYNQYPDVVAVLDQLAQIYRRRVPAEAPAEDENLLLELAVGRFLPG